LDPREPEFPLTPRATEEVARQHLIAVLCRIKLPPGTSLADGDTFLEGREAAAFLRVSHRTLQRLRQNGEGPPAIRIGRRRLVYGLAELQRWALGLSSLALREETLGRPISEVGEATDPTKQSNGVSNNLPPDVCGLCQAFGNGRCHERGLAVGAEEQCCPLFVPVG
jgi:hypothetical protein